MKIELGKLINCEFWKRLNPALHVEEKNFLTHQSIIELKEDVLQSIIKDLVEDGYFHLDPIEWKLPLNEMKNAIVNFNDMGFPLPFVFVYDEFFSVPYKLSQILSLTLGNNFKILPDFWAWYVDPLKSEKGWTPHRDTGIDSLLKDGMPKSLTVWIPLTKATPNNGCMYVVPAQWDTYFINPKDNYNNFPHQCIRALPAEPGSILAWNQAIMHWGGRSNSKAKEPRISFAIEFQRSDVPPYNEPLLPYNELPNLELRLKLIGKQILQYDHMYPLSDNLKNIAKEPAKDLKPKTEVHNF